MPRHRIFASAGLLITFAVPLWAYDGTITAAGYQPPPNVTVFWRTFSGGDIIRKLNPAISWSGSNSDAAGYLGRYAEGKSDVLGRWIASQGVETQGGLSFLILRALFRDAGITRDPDQREVLDFGIVHGGQRQLGCADFARLVGRPDPTCKETPPPPGGLRPQPTHPVGCCKKSLPCVVDDRRKPGEVWNEAVLTPQGGRKGCYMMQPAVAPGDGTPGDKPDDQPDDKPGDKPGDEPGDQPGDTPGDKPGEPKPAAQCFFLKIEGASASVTPVPCDQVPATPPPG